VVQEFLHQPTGGTNLSSKKNIFWETTKANMAAYMFCLLLVYQ